MTTAMRMKTDTLSVVAERQQLLESFELALDAAALSHATIRLYRFGIRKLYRFLDRIGLDASLSGISAEHLREFLRSERQGDAGVESDEADARNASVRHGAASTSCCSRRRTHERACRCSGPGPRRACSARCEPAPCSSAGRAQRADCSWLPSIIRLLWPSIIRRSPSQLVARSRQFDCLL